MFSFRVCSDIRLTFVTCLPFPFGHLKVVRGSVMDRLILHPMLGAHSLEGHGLIFVIDSSDA